MVLKPTRRACSSLSVESSFKSFKIAHNFHFENSFYSRSPVKIFIFHPSEKLRTLCIQNPTSYLMSSAFLRSHIFVHRSLPSNLRVELILRVKRVDFHALAEAATDNLLANRFLRVPLRTSYERLIIGTKLYLHARMSTHHKPTYGYE
jgi:hypothetical protein